MHITYCVTTQSDAIVSQVLDYTDVSVICINTEETSGRIISNLFIYNVVLQMKSKSNLVFKVTWMFHFIKTVLPILYPPVK